MDIENHNDYDPSTLINATEQGPICIQGTPGWTPGVSIAPQRVNPGSEDCLLLDVLVPETPAGTNLPVMVQIHGGGYAVGNAETYPGYALVNQSQGNLIYVTIQYRLNAFGFLSSTEVRENGAANAGLLDQRAALMWVQRNIRPFGGDPSKVTIIGGSAGGGSVMNQMILYGGEANPPFRAVISEYPWVSQVRSPNTCADLTRPVPTISQQHHPRGTVSRGLGCLQLFQLAVSPISILE